MNTPEPTEAQPPMEPQQLKCVVEAALLAAGQPLNLDKLLALFPEETPPSRDELRAALCLLAEECVQRGIELKEVSSGYRLQVKVEFAPWVSRLWEERPQRYSRALLETLVLIAYRQPITRADIEDIRGVGVSSHIIKTLQEREWIRIVGHREVPGHPELFGTTRAFLDYFNLKTLDDLPTLSEVRSLEEIAGTLGPDVEAALTAMAAALDEPAAVEALPATAELPAQVEDAVEEPPTLH